VDGRPEFNSLVWSEPPETNSVAYCSRPVTSDPKDFPCIGRDPRGRHRRPAPVRSEPAAHRPSTHQAMKRQIVVGDRTMRHVQFSHRHRLPIFRVAGSCTRALACAQCLCPLRADLRWQCSRCASCQATFAREGSPHNRGSHLTHNHKCQTRGVRFAPSLRPEQSHIPQCGGFAVSFCGELATVLS